MQRDSQTTHIYCKSCDGIVIIKPQETSVFDISGKFKGHDLLCEKNHVIATVFEVVK